MKPAVHNSVSYAGAALFYILSKRSFDVSIPTLMWITHFVRRTLESFLLFNYSQDNVSIADSVQEFAYYWIFAWWICKSVDVNTNSNSFQVIIGEVIWFIGEYCNFSCHSTLAALSAKREKKRIDSGAYLFSTISCPHYFFEILSWFGFNIVTGFSRAGTLFMLVGGTIMTCWAVQKHERYPQNSHKTPVFPFVDIRPPRFLIDALAK
jgi:very-long-chain enoyl-CoA reductase